MSNKHQQAMWFVCLFIMHNFVTRGRPYEIREYRGIRNKFLNELYSSTSGIKSSFARSQIICVIYCTENDSCQSVYYDSTNKECHLVSRLYHDRESETYRDGYRHISVFQDLDCPSDYKLRVDGAMCYKYFPPDGTDYFACQQRCWADGGYIVKVTSPERTLELSSLNGTIRVQGNRVDVGTVTIWTYDDGQPIEDITWDNNEPDLRSGEQNVVLTRRGTWRDVRPWDTQWGCVCEIPLWNSI